MRNFLIGLPVLLCLQAPVASSDLSEYRSQVARLIGDHRWTEAIEVVRKGLRLDQNDPYLLITGSALYFQLGRPARSDELLSRGTAQPGLSPQLLRLAAGVHRGQGRLEESARLLERALKVDEGQAETHYEFALTSYLRGEERTALDAVFNAVQLNKGEVRYRELYALLLDKSGQTGEAYHQLRMARRLAPQNARLLLSLADRARFKGEYEEALEYLDLAVDLDPENSLYHYEKAKVLRRLDLGAQASEANQQGVYLEQLLDLYVSALSLASREKYREAREILEVPVRSDARFVRGALLLADLHQKLGEPEQALQIYLRLLEQDSNLQAAREQGAWIQASEGDLEAAVRLLKQGDTASLNEVLFRGHQLLQDGHWADALEHFKMVQRAYPLDADLLSVVSRCLGALGEMEDALEYLDRASRIEPLNPRIKTEKRDIQYRHALALMGEERWEEALAAFTVLEGDFSEDAAIDFHVAYILQNLGRYREAAERYERGLRAEPGREWVRINLAYCYYLTLDFAKASRQWEYLVDQRRTPEYLYNFGLSRLREFRVEEGWSLVERAAREGYGPAKSLVEQRDRRARYRTGLSSVSERLQRKK